MMTKQDALDAISQEVTKATNKFPPFNSPHEGFAILKEEVDELWDEVKAHDPSNEVRPEAMRKEATQVAAMALRFLTDL